MLIMKNKKNKKSKATKHDRDPEQNKTINPRNKLAGDRGKENNWAQQEQPARSVSRSVYILRG